ncbi:uncharacterized protein LOC133528181 [Cydia pomonella]|uniref:uncharacterized protein LOC133528181 n=1 Tax=Cydia pomonella TaxID=82600 RepID=UPI002ADE296F|nr:uncharacterized protein LOC133528181 [Cydia pomonella]
MEPKNLLTPVLGLLLIANYVTAIQWDYEFGKKNEYTAGLIEKEGEIGSFSYRNSYKLDVPELSVVTHIRVTVWSLSPPKVDYDWNTNTVSIVYSFIQITISTFKIHVEGIPYIVKEIKG